MSKTIVISIVSVFIGIVTTILVIYAVDFYNMRVTVVNDHATLTDVVKFINDSVAQNQAANTKK